MLKQTELSAEDQAEAFRRADALYRTESEQAQNAKAAADAAEELGIPQEYLDRAAAQLHAERVEKIKSQRTRRSIFFAAGFGVLGILLLTTLFQARQTTGPGGISPPLSASQSAALDLSQIDEATTRFTNAETESSGSGGSYTLNIKQFTPQGNNYQANVGFPVSGSLAGYKKVSFLIHGDGVSHARVDLRAGQTRWNSPQLDLTSTPQRVSLDLSSLQRQTKQGNQWVGSAGTGPENAQSLVFKFGSEINPPDTKGTVTILDVRFE
jgi:hypothetical protein